MRDRLRGLARHPMVQVLAASLVTQALGFVVGIVSVRILSVAEVGVLTQILVLLATVVPVVVVGVPDAMVVLSQREPARTARVLHAGRRVLAGQTLIATLAFVMVGSLNGLGGGVIAAATIGIPASFMIGQGQAQFQIEARFGELNRVLVLTNIVTLGLLCLALLGLAPATLGFVVLARGLGNLAVIAPVMIRERRGRAAAGSWGTERSLLRLGGTFHLTAVLAVAASRADQLLATSLLDAQGLGHYGVALTFAMTVRQFGAAVSMVGLPELVGLTDEVARRRLFWRRVVLVSVGGAATAGLVAVGGAYAIPLAFGQEFAPAVDLLLFMAAGAAVAAVNDAAIRLQRAFKLVRPGVAGRVIGIAVAVVTTPLLVSAQGGRGAALAFLLVPLAMLLGTLGMFAWPKARG